MSIFDTFATVIGKLIFEVNNSVASLEKTLLRIFEGQKIIKEMEYLVLLTDEEYGKNTINVTHSDLI